MENGLETLRSNARMVLDILRRDIEIDDASHDYLSNMHGKLAGVSLMLAGNGGMDDLNTEIESLAHEVTTMQGEIRAAMRKAV